MVEFLYHFNDHPDSVTYHFINSNPFDLRTHNVELRHKGYDHVSATYSVLDYFPGHYSNIGKDAFQMKNPIWKVCEKNNTKDIFLVMYCEPNAYTKLCEQSYKCIQDYETHTNLKKITWCKQIGGYINGSLSGGSKLFIHQIIMNCFGNGKGTGIVSVDHKDQDPLNNQLSNLHVATREMQEQNTTGIKLGTKKNRQHNARPLPDGIDQSMLKKYVVYYFEWLNKEKTNSREFFKVEHPGFTWISSKSGKVSIMDKLNAANQVAESGMVPVSDKILPKYVHLKTMRDKPHLVFERRNEGVRMTVAMSMDDDYNLAEELQMLNEKVKKKYIGYSVL